MNPNPPAGPSGTGSPPGLRGWFDREVRPHESALRGWLRAHFPTVLDLDDLVQEAYLRLFRAKAAEAVEHPKAYLFATARNAALDSLRRQRVVAFEPLADLDGPAVLEDGPDAADAARRDQELEILAAAIRALPPRCRKIMVLRKHHGLSHREIAERLGISTHTVNAQITLGMMRCREYFRARGLAC